MSTDPDRSPRAVPGSYQARLTVDSITLAQPLRIAMDPRSPATASDLEQQLQLGREIFAEAVRSRQALSEAKAVQQQLSELEQRLGTDHADIKSTLSQLESEIRKILGGSEDSTTNAAGLESASTGLASALAVVESGDRAVPSQAIALYHESSQAMKLRIADWNLFKTTQLPQLNQHLRKENIAPIVISQLPEEEEPG